MDQVHISITPIFQATLWLLITVPSFAYPQLFCHNN